jgi:hypothetical protein
MATAGFPFILPRGVTGFGDKYWMPKAHAFFSELKTLSHDVARRTHGRIVSKSSDLFGANFHTLHMEGRGYHLSILLNAFFPLVGFAEVLREEGEEPIFTEIPSDFSTLTPSAFTFIGKSILISPPDESSLAQLSSAEIEQVQYWRPRRLGDIIFNYWD